MPKINAVGVDLTAGGSNLYYFPALTTCTIASANKVYTLPTRALNTTYANSSTASSLMVMATVRCAVTLAAGTAYVQGRSDSANPPTISCSGIVGIQAGLLNEDNTYQICFVVGTNTNYIITSVASNGSCVLGQWYELIF